MTTREKVLIAGAGALMPILANLYFVDLQQVFANFDPVVLLVYLLKASILFGVGCLMGYLNQDEEKRATLFEIGLGVPALLLAALNGHAYASEALAHGHGDEKKQGSFLGLRTVYAQAGRRSKPLSLPPETTKEKVLRGLGLGYSERAYFVIAASYRTAEEAERALAALQARAPELKAQVNASTSTRESLYAVVVGEPGTLEEAQATRQRALQLGLSQAYVWKFGLPMRPASLGQCGPVEKFRLLQKRIYRLAEDPQIYLYAEDIHSRRPFDLYIIESRQDLTSTKAAEPLARRIKGETYKSTTIRKKESVDFLTSTGRTYRFIVTDAQDGKPDFIEVEACRML